MLNKHVYTKAPLILGVIAAFVHKVEMDAVFANGVLQEFSPLTVVMIALAVIAGALFAFFALKIPKTVLSGADYAGAFRSNLWFFILDAVNAVSFLSVGAYLFIKTEAPGIADYVMMALAVLAGIAFIVLGFSAYRRRDNAFTAAFSLFPSVFFAFLMTMTYREWAGSPSTLNYCWAIVAFGLSAVAWYSCAGFAFGKGSARKCVFFLAASVFCLCTLVGEGGEAWRMAISLSGVILAELNIYRITAFIE